MTNLKIWRAQRTTVSSAIPSMLSKHSSSKSYKINVNIKPWHEQKYLQSDSILINGVQKWSKNNETLGKTRVSHLSWDFNFHYFFLRLIHHCPKQLSGQSKITHIRRVAAKLSKVKQGYKNRSYNIFR